MRPENLSPPVDDPQPNAAVQAAANVVVQLVAAPGIATLPIVDRIDPYKKCTRNRRVVSSQYLFEPDAELVSLPDIRKLAIQKLIQCQKVFYFCDPLRNVKSIEVKRAALNGLLNYYMDQRLTPGDAVYPAIIRMATTNLFRELPPPLSSDFDPEEDERTLELAWPDLHLVYELFLCFIENQGFCVGVGKKLIDSNFVLNILRLFDSEGPREPDYLKMMLHRV